MSPDRDDRSSREIDAAANRELVRTQREVNEQLVLSTLRAQEEAEAAEAVAGDLRASEQALRTLADTIPILAWYANPDGFVPWYNQRWYDYTGTSLDEQQGWQWQSVHDPVDLPRVLSKWNAALASGEAWEDEFRLRRHDGQFRWFLARAMPLRDGAGRVVRWFGTSVDIDDQKRAAEALRRRGVLATLAAEIGRAATLGGTLREVLDRCCAAVIQHLDAAFVRVWIVDASGGVLELQASAGRGSDVGGSRACIRVGDPEIGAIAAARQAHVTDDVVGDPFIVDRSWAARMGMVSFAGYPLVVAARLVGVLALFARHPLDTEAFDALGAIANTIAIGIARLQEEEERVRLLASQQEARREAEAANRVVNEFLATMSHELRTPLNAILGWSTMLRRGVAADSGRERALETIERNARAQARLIDDILDVSRIISGKLRLDQRRVDIKAIARASMDVVRPAADAKRLRLIVEPATEDEVDGLVGDADRLQQVIWNLLSNAVKFTPPEGSVFLGVERSGALVRVKVRDTGPGIPPEHLPFVFERFRQVDSSTTRKYGGLGLGLAIVRHIVEMHGGWVTAESGGSESGATFTVNLPIRAVEAEAEVESEAKPTPTGSQLAGALTGVRILVVDDDGDTRLLLEVALERLGASVNAVDSARAAFALIENDRFDLLISDIGMPDEDGFSLLRRVRALPAIRGGHVPALALTAYARKEDAARAREAGYQAHLAKPADIDEVTRAVVRLARSSH